MASRIKGITVEIGGDTTKLTDALRDVNNEVYNTQVQLKDVEKLLKLDPSNTELLAQKQRILNEEVQATKDKLEALISLLNLTQEEYDALSSSMNNCSGIAGETASVMQDNLQSKVEQLGGSLESLAIKLSEYVIPYLTGLVELAAVEADSSGETEAGTIQRDVVRQGVVTISVSFSVTAKWLKLLTAYSKEDKLAVEYFDTEAAGLKNTEMYVEGFQAKLKKDTSYRGLWTVSFILKEF